MTMISIKFILQPCNRRDTNSQDKPNMCLSLPCVSTLPPFFKRMLLVGACLLSLNGNGQNLYVNLKNLSTESFPLSSVRSISFQQGNMLVNGFNGTSTAYPIANILHYNFVNTTGYAVPAVHDKVQVFPNPASEEVQIGISSSWEGRISIQIIDASGKCVDKVYEGMHRPGTAYHWKVHLPAGTYYCLVQNALKTICQPLIIQ